MVQYKLSYFDIRGLGETARLILHYANVPFEDDRIKEEDWPSRKASMRKLYLFLLFFLYFQIVLFVFQPLPSGHIFFPIFFWAFFPKKNISKLGHAFRLAEANFFWNFSFFNLKIASGEACFSLIFPRFSGFFSFFGIFSCFFMFFRIF